MIPRKKILQILSFHIVFLCVVNYLALPFLWYYRIWWFDMPMHFWGGVVVLFVLLYTLYPLVTLLRVRHQFLLLLGVFFVGVGWEVFEYIMNNWWAGQTFSLLDTLSDICFDMAGGGVALLYVTHRESGIIE